MEFLKNLWLKIMACICCTQNHEIPNTEKQNSEQSQKPQTENNVDNITHDDTRRMFNGALSSKVQGDLFLGIEKSDHIVIQRAIDNGADVNAPVNGLEPLQYAIRHGKDYIIEFLLEKGAEIKPSHVELAQSYKLIYESNLDEKDMAFYQGNKQQKINAEICEYQIIANFLQQEMLRQQRKKEQEKNALSDTDSDQDSTPKNTSIAPQSSRPQFLMFSSPAAKSSAQNENDSD